MAGNTENAPGRTPTKPAPGSATDPHILQSPLSVIKMDVSELKKFTGRVNDFLHGPDVAAIRICECCINVE